MAGSVTAFNTVGTYDTLFATLLSVERAFEHCSGGDVGRAEAARRAGEAIGRSCLTPMRTARADEPATIQDLTATIASSSGTTFLKLHRAPTGRTGR